MLNKSRQQRRSSVYRCRNHNYQNYLNKSQYLVRKTPDRGRSDACRIEFNISKLPKFEEDRQHSGLYCFRQENHVKKGPKAQAEIIRSLKNSLVKYSRAKKVRQDLQKKILLRKLFKKKYRIASKKVLNKYSSTSNLEKAKLKRLEDGLITQFNKERNNEAALKIQKWCRKAVMRKKNQEDQKELTQAAMVVQRAWKKRREKRL
ncbi:unnamed protein product [Moneuplotes crassus]|uniref:Uncharacterized protein n=1 Tax=Euplotes crassus TaxID=5936 RepID=A0AAD1XNK1_EUPCR|nr:unnamed protein product [Moneuplotes crassus]